MTDFEDLPLSAPARRALEAEGLTSLEILATKTRDEVAEVRGIAPGTVAILEDALQERGLRFAAPGEPAGIAAAAPVEPVATAPVAPATSSTQDALPAYNVFAIVALASSFVIPIIGIVFGHLALRELRTTAQYGREMAIVGLVVGYVLTAAYALAIVATILFSIMMMLVPMALIPFSIMHR